MEEKKRRYELFLRLSFIAYGCAFAVCMLAGIEPAWEKALAGVFLTFVLLGAAASGIAGEYSDFREVLSPKELEELEKMIREMKELNQEKLGCGKENY